MSKCIDHQSLNNWESTAIICLFLKSYINIYNIQDARYIALNKMKLIISSRLPLNCFLHLHHYFIANFYKLITLPALNLLIFFIIKYSSGIRHRIRKFSTQHIT